MTHLHFQLDLLPPLLLYFVSFLTLNLHVPSMFSFVFKKKDALSKKTKQLNHSIYSLISKAVMLLVHVSFSTFCSCVSLKHQSSSKALLPFAGIQVSAVAD